MSIRTTLVAFMAAGIAGCSPGDASQSAQADEAVVPPRDTAFTAMPDSMAQMPVLLRRFQVGMTAPTGLAGAAPSRDALVARWAQAVAQRDAAALERLRVSREEFAHLFFPASVFMQPPYELDPEIVWMQIDGESEKAISRTLRTYGGRAVAVAGLVCTEPQVHGPVRLWGCDVRRATGRDTTVERLFGAILERDGAFKFLSLGNRL